MTNTRLARPLATLLFLLAMGVGSLNAQTAATPESIRTRLTQSLGAPTASLEVSSTTSLLTVLRINTVLNGSTHSHRNQEAERIALTVSEALKGLPNAATIVAFNVEYVKRAKLGGRDRLVDRVEFRKGPDGTFTLHTT